MASQLLSQTAYQSFHSGGGGGGPINTAQSIGNSNLNSQSPMYQTTTSNFGAGLTVPQGGSRIKVAVRIRPLLEQERQQGHDCQRLKVQNSNEVVITNDDQTGSRQKVFKFDQVFHQTTSQSDVYYGLGLTNLVSKVIEGYHGTIFAYGQTGSGKTFTMEGYDSNSGMSMNDFNKKASPAKQAHMNEHIGITQRCINELYGQLHELRKTEKTSGRHYQVFCSFLQIYNEKVFDLLNQSTLNMLGNKKGMPEQLQKQGLRIRWTKKDQFVVENLYVFECQSAEEALELFRLGSKNRVLAAHNLNDMSSRSHTIFCLTIESQDIAHQEMVTVSKLQLVDLAGSEKQALTGTTGQQAKESIDINKSLLVLRKVITALTESRGPEKMNFIPYRESKLTCLLKQSLGGNSYTLMVACLSPSDRFLEENLSTLNYAARAQLISNVPTKNIDPRVMEIDEQKRKIIELEKELRSANQHIQFLTQMNDERGKRIQALEQQIQNKEEGGPTNFDSPSSKLPLIKKLDPIPLTTPATAAQQQRTITSPKSGNSGGQTPVNQQLGLQQQMSVQKRTQMNFYLQQDKQKQDAAQERLIHSVNTVTDLLKSNTELRDKVERMRREKEETDGEVFTLSIENQTLRERLELVEGILKNNRENYEQMVSDKVKTIMHKSNTQYGKFNMNASLEHQQLQQQQPDFTIDAVYTELIQLRQQNRVLETRIKQLELQNFTMTRGGSQGIQSAGGPVAKLPQTVKNIEPNRPIFEGAGSNGGQSDEEEYDDEDDEYDDEQDDQRQKYMMRLEQVPPQNLVSIPSSKRNQMGSLQGESQAQLASNDGFKQSAVQGRKESQPVPDQRYYTKTNFFTINNNGGSIGAEEMAIADKYAHLHSQKQQRRSNHQNPGDFQGSEQDHLQLHHRLQSFTEGMHPRLDSGGQQQYFQQKNREAKNKFVLKPIDESLQDSMIGAPQDFVDSSGILVKRKIKKKRMNMMPQGIPELMPQMVPQQQTNNNISMVMVMSNLMTKRKNRKKRTSNSVYQNKKPQQPKYINPDFYF